MKSVPRRKEKRPLESDSLAEERRVCPETSVLYGKLKLCHTAELVESRIRRSEELRSWRLVPLEEPAFQKTRFPSERMRSPSKEREMEKERRAAAAARQTGKSEGRWMTARSSCCVDLMVRKPKEKLPSEVSKSLSKRRSEERGGGRESGFREKPLDKAVSARAEERVWRARKQRRDGRRGLIVLHACGLLPPLHSLSFFLFVSLLCAERERERDFLFVLAWLHPLDETFP